MSLNIFLLNSLHKPAWIRVVVESCHKHTRTLSDGHIDIDVIEKINLFGTMCCEAVISLPEV